jgi:hypothetical protein
VEIRDWQHLGAAGLEPPFGLLGVALGAAPIFAGVIREHLGTALIAAPDVSAEGGGSAVQNVGDRAPVRCRHRSAMDREVVLRETAEDLGDLDHGQLAASEAGHHPVEDAPERDAGWLGQVGIDGGGRDVAVAEQNLHNPGIDAVLKEPSRIAMA